MSTHGQAIMLCSVIILAIIATVPAKFFLIETKLVEKSTKTGSVEPNRATQGAVASPHPEVGEETGGDYTDDYMDSSPEKPYDGQGFTAQLPGMAGEPAHLPTNPGLPNSTHSPIPPLGTVGSVNNSSLAAGGGGVGRGSFPFESSSLGNSTFASNNSSSSHGNGTSLHGGAGHKDVSLGPTNGSLLGSSSSSISSGISPVGGSPAVSELDTSSGVSDPSQEVSEYILLDPPLDEKGEPIVN